MAIAAVALILAGSFFLPNAVAGVTDLRRLDSMILIDSQSISFDFSPELSVPERLALTASPNTERLPVITGNSMQEEAAGAKAARELVRFFGGGPFELEYSELSIDEGSAMLIVDAAVPAQNMIIWEFNIYDPAGNTVTVAIDDETGIIVRLIYVLGGSCSIMETEKYGSQDERFFAAANNLAEMMKSYYGVPVELADYQFSGSLSYYRADIDSGGQIIPMYGVVRAANFTMNERLY